MPTGAYIMLAGMVFLALMGVAFALWDDHRIRKLKKKK